MIPPDLRAWIEAEAEELGCDAATWLRMLAVDARRHGRKLAFPQYGPPAQRELPLPERHVILPDAPVPTLGDDDGWRGPVEEEPQPATNAELEAVIARKLAEAEAAGATQPAVPTEMFARQPPGLQAGGGSIRALSRPAPKYAPALQPAHLRAL